MRFFQGEKQIFFSVFFIYIKVSPTTQKFSCTFWGRCRHQKCGAFVVLRRARNYSVSATPSTAPHCLIPRRPVTAWELTHMRSMCAVARYKNCHIQTCTTSQKNPEHFTRDIFADFTFWVLRLSRFRRYNRDFSHRRRDKPLSPRRSRIHSRSAGKIPCRFFCMSRGKRRAFCLSP